MNEHSESAMLGSVAVMQDSGISRKLRSRSPFRALVWKEWREQRLIWAALLALSFATEVAVRLAPVRGDLREVLFLLIPFLWGSMATLMGANAFTGDRDTDNESFMGALPVSLRFQFWVKIAVVAALLWAAQALTALCMPQTDWYWLSVDNNPPTYFRYYLLVSFSLGMILLSLTAACVASWASSTLSAVIQTAVVGPCLLFWMAFMGRLLYAVRQTVRSSDATARWAALATALVLAHVVMLVWAYRLWTAAGGNFFRHVRRAATVLLLFLFVLLAPAAAPYIKATLMAPVFPEGWSWTVPSPAGRYALISFIWPEGPWQFNDRVFLLDTENSRTVRLSRLRASVLTGTPWTPERGMTWSPDGTRFVFDTSDQWTFPTGVLCPFPPWAAKGGKSWWVDAAGGKVHYLRPWSDDIEQRNWWWGDHTLAFREGHGMVFEDLQTGERRVCGDPALAGRGASFSLNGAATDLYEFESVNSASASLAGIWTFAYLRGGRRGFQCYRPDATEASVVRPRLPESGNGFTLGAFSPDGRWAVLTKWAAGPPAFTKWFLCSLETGVTDEIGPVDGNLLGGDLRESFTPDSKTVLLCGRQGVGL